MPIRKFTIDPPFVHQAGDIYAREGNTVRQIRGGLTIDTRMVGGGSLLTAQVRVGGSNVTEFFEEQTMPGIISTLTNVAVNQTTGAVRFDFAGGTQREFTGGVADALNSVKYLDEEESTTQDMLILKTLRNSPDGANLENILGASCSADFTANQPVVLTVE